jgi:hypothetical protein
LALLAVCAFCVLATGLPIAIHPEMTRCIDYTDHVVAPELCSTRQEVVHVHGSLNPEPLYRPYYGGFGTGEPGSFAWGGSDRPLGGRLYASASPAQNASASPAQTPPPDLETTPQPYPVAHAR